MELNIWRVANGYSYENLARALGLTTSKTYRICKSDPCIRLADAHKIVVLTAGEVDFCDLLIQGDCA
jgi:hypothetical protein